MSVTVPPLSDSTADALLNTPDPLLPFSPLRGHIPVPEDRAACCPHTVPGLPVSARASHRCHCKILVPTFTRDLALPGNETVFLISTPLSMVTLSNLLNPQISNCIVSHVPVCPLLSADHLSTADKIVLCRLRPLLPPAPLQICPFLDPFLFFC